MPAPSLSPAARNTSILAVNFTNNDGAGSNFSVEINRSDDFASDDSQYFDYGSAPGGASTLNFIGLPSDTPYYMRDRNIAGGAWSNPLLYATLPATALTAYAGYSIDKAVVVVPVDIRDISGVGFQGSSARPGNPARNLLLDDPQAIFATANAGGYVLQFQTSGEPVDTIALLGSLENDETTWQIQSAPDAEQWNAAGATNYQAQFRCSPTIGRRKCYHALATLPAPSTNRYWRIIVASVCTVGSIARNLVVGLARASVNPSRGSTSAVNDMGSAGRTRFGTIDRVSGWRGKLVDFEMSWMSEAEFYTKWAALPQLVGKTKSIMAIPNSKRNLYLNDRIALGTITGMSAENVQSFKHTQGISIDSIY